MAETYKFPTEFVELPSKGYFYPEGHSLQSGKVEIKYMTAKEEDILTSGNLIQKGIVLDKLLEALIVSDVNLDDILVGDKNAIMLASRVLAYGKEYSFEFTDETSARKRTHTVDLTSFEDKKIDFSKCEKGKNEFEFQLPTSKKTITFKLLNQSDDTNIAAELKAMKKFTKESGIDPEITTRLKASILSVDGNRDRKTINEFVDNEFLSRDSLAYRKNLTSITPDVDMTTYVDMDDGTDKEMTVPVTVQFFWPSPD